MDMNISPLFERVNKLAVLTSINYSNKFAYMRYGERLKLARGDRTQEWLASEAKVSQSLIWQLENSTTAKGSQYTNRFARVLKVSADWLAGHGWVAQGISSFLQPTDEQISRLETDIKAIYQQALRQGIGQYFSAYPKVPGHPDAPVQIRSLGSPVIDETVKH